MSARLRNHATVWFLLGATLVAGCSVDGLPSEPGQLLVDPATADLGPVDLAGERPTQRVTLANPGDLPTRVESVTIEGVDSSWLTVNTEWPVTVEGGQIDLADVGLVLPPDAPTETQTATLTFRGLAATGEPGDPAWQPVERSMRISFSVRGTCDADEDGFFAVSCGGLDCDDTDPLRNPGAEEVCNGRDDDCNGTVDDAVDADEDGFTICTDCDDTDASRSPGLDEICDGVDNDCDGALLPGGEQDDDGDGFPVCDDCDDTESRVNPAAAEVCDGVDTNCDGVLPEDEADDDRDGVLVCDGDCDDTDPTVSPALFDTCDGRDDDCNGTIDDGGDCPCPVEVRDDSAYLLCELPSSWYDARATCLGVGYDLLVIDDATEDASIDRLVDAYDEDSKWWMGYSDREDEGDWKWATGSSSTYENWSSDEPNDAGGREDCGQLNRYTDGTWNDEPCSFEIPFVCESLPR